MCPHPAPSLTCHMNRELVIYVIVSHIGPSLHPEKVSPCVPCLCASYVQGAVVGLGVPDEVESALGLLLHFTIGVVCGYWIILAWAGPFPEPVAMSWGRVCPASLGVHHSAGHGDAQAFLQHHGPLYIQLESWILSQGPCGERRLSPSLHPSPHALPWGTHPPTAGPTAAAAAAASLGVCVGVSVSQD